MSATRRRHSARHRWTAATLLLAAALAALVTVAALGATATPAAPPRDVQRRLYRRAPPPAAPAAPIDEAQPGLSLDGPEDLPLSSGDEDDEDDGAASGERSLEYEKPVAVPVAPVRVSEAGPVGKQPGRHVGGAAAPPAALPDVEDGDSEAEPSTPATGEGDARAPPRGDQRKQADGPTSAQPAVGNKDDDEEEEAAATRRSLITSSLMIIVSEIGDKTFLVAAILAMSHPRAVVFIAAWSALAIMSVLSAVVGNVLPALVSRTYTQALAGLLFVVFGYKMLREGRAMDADAGTEEEMAEVVAEIKARDKYERIERGTSPTRAGAAAANKNLFERCGDMTARIAAYVLSPIFVETFVLTFLAEWGDRSQIATIAMAASGHILSVILGTVVGHSLCTGLAVVGGKMLAARISVRTVTIVGGITFLIFAVLTFLYLE